jgi:hypothetical protein
MPAKGETTVINGAYLTSAMERRGGMIYAGTVAATVVAKIVSESLWVTLTIYLITPLVVLGAAVGGRGLMIPRRVAYRIAAAVLVPLVIFSGVLQAIGYPASGTLGEEGALIAWCFAAFAMAAWAGVLARRMYVPAKRQERRS